MATNVQSVFDYLTVTELLTTLNRERLKEIRSTYDQLKSAQYGGAATNVDELVKMLTQKFFIVDDIENLDRLKRCVTEDYFEVACQTLLNEYLTKLRQERMNARKTPTALLPNNLCGGLLIPGSTLDEFIRFQLLARGRRVDVGRPLAKLPLAEPIVLVDEFDTWHFDYLRNLFELNLLPPEKLFPKIWKLDENTELFYLLELPNNSNSTNQEDDQRTRNVDRPSTVSLQRFVEDVCEKENNGMTKKWLDALHEDDIFTYDHLVNLKYNEWNELRKLSMNGRKILKSYVDREKQMTNDTKTLSKVEESDSNKGIQSMSELRAKVHQVKLYFQYILADKFNAARVPTPAKLDAECVRLSFDEMREEGFEDDGLFDQMKLFFLPLTMIEKDVAIDKAQMFSLSRRHDIQRRELMERKARLIDELIVKENEYYTHDDSVNKLRQEIRFQQQMSNKDEQQDYDKFTPLQLLNIHKQEMESLEDERHKLQTLLQATDDLLDSLERGLEEYNVDHISKRDKDLIRPNRGFIMYGPPG
ncbi:unnamed protein product [Rotaria sp. Silwood1]|nr:unnamed protein product [Rotaria sp. Silwood1]CAF3793609.1 unnamed protein product [Rotaria sp. Silwood1]CAF3897028.1 unnamed protein product [Rotaria sp. Silwood1]